MTTTFSDFSGVSLAQGFEEVIERSWQPNEIVEMHTHPFVLHALVVSGQMWLTQANVTRELCPGDTFDLTFEEPHAERYGPDGATFWVARRAPIS